LLGRAGVVDGVYTMGVDTHKPFTELGLSYVLA
jgi:hypothetical protein